MAWPDGLPVRGGNRVFKRWINVDTHITPDIWSYLGRSHRSWGTVLSLVERSCHSNLSPEPTNRDVPQTEALKNGVMDTVCVQCKRHHHHHHCLHHDHHRLHHPSSNTHHFSIRLTQSPTTATHTSLMASACCTWNHMGKNRKKVLRRSVAMETDRK